MNGDYGPLSATFLRNEFVQFIIDESIEIVG